MSSLSPRLRALIASYDQQIHQISSQKQSEPIRTTHEDGGDQQKLALLEYREQLLARISHDFRAHLTAIRTSNAILRTHYDRLTRERRAEQFGKIDKQITHMADLLDNVLSISRIHQGIATFKLAKLNPVLFCLDLIEQARSADHG